MRFRVSWFAASYFVVSCSPPVCQDTFELRSTIDRIEERTGCLIAYEELAEKRPASAPLRHVFSEHAGDAGKAGCGSALERVVAAYNARCPFARVDAQEVNARWRVSRSGITPLLDTPITVPVRERLPFTTLIVIADFLSVASGARVIASTGLAMGFDEAYGGPFVSWGVENKPAFAALESFAAGSRTVMTWRLLCNPDEPGLPGDCVLSVTPLVRE